MSWTTDLLTGVAELAADAGIGDWNPDGEPYTAAQTAICLSQMPPEPDRAIVLSLYPVSQDGTGDVTVGLQVRTRAGPDPREVQTIADAMNDLLDGLERVELGGVWVSQIYLRSGSDLGTDKGIDKAARMERADNYYCQALRETQHRP